MRLRRPRPRWLTPLTAVCLVAAACQARPPEAAGPRPDVLLITVDTLRPDALGWAGGPPTPTLDALARTGFAFPAAVAPMPLTLPSHLSLLSGRLPRRHGVRDNGQVSPGQAPLLSELLAARGYTTAAFVSGLPLAAEFGADAGFGHYDDVLTAGGGAWLERPAPATAAAAAAWLARAPEPWFLWIHFFDPHLPYEPPAELARAGSRGAYLGEVALVDRTLGPLLDRIRARSTHDVLTIFTADHGESLGEHGEATHGYFIYDSTMLVPLVFHWPGRLDPGASAEPAQLIDVMPTVLELLALPSPGELDGVSLAPLLRGEPWRSRPAYLETLQPWTSYGWSPLSAVREAGWKLIVAPAPELYDLRSDPSESLNRLAEHPGRVRELKRLHAEIESRPAVGARETADAATLRRLEALGYLGAGATIEPPAGELADPKERLPVRDQLTEALELSDAGNLGAALSLFDRVLEAEPDNRFALSRSGAALVRLGDLERAIPRLERAVELHPLDVETRSLLADTLLGAGRFERAVEHWRELAAQRPRRARHWSNLGAALGRSGQAAQAVTALERALELEPEAPARRARLAFARHAAGDPGGAVRELSALAADLGPERFEHAGALGLLLLELGRLEEARPWLEASRPPEGDFPRARLALARLLLDSGERAGATEALRQGVALEPGLRSLVAGDPRLRELL